MVLLLLLPMLLQQCWSTRIITLLLEHAFLRMNIVVLFNVLLQVPSRAADSAANVTLGRVFGMRTLSRLRLFRLGALQEMVKVLKALSLS